MEGYNLYANLDNAHTAIDFDFYVTVISCDLGVAWCSVHGSEVGCADDLHLLVRIMKCYVMVCVCVCVCAHA